MKRRWCDREGIFECDNRLWWLNRNMDYEEKSSTPMAIALKNGDISKVIDVKLGGLSGLSRRRGIF
ncbi:MAG: hypothetical protein JSV56_07670 [Methanomassiliicoccales archaeon]|nr:MAG: hypothetical protein JSV56_07670 [Methanomassiliicoccales archaeon]